MSEVLSEYVLLTKAQPCQGTSSGSEEWQSLVWGTKYEWCVQRMSTITRYLWSEVCPLQRLLPPKLAKLVFLIML